jgi:hypothetical protein
MHTNYLFRRWLLFVALLTGFQAAHAAAGTIELVEVRKIWDAGGHNAFTDLIRWQGRWWCVFREADGHVGGDGLIRVLTSTDGAKWESAATLVEKDVDLRDPKLSETPDGRLMIVCGGSIYLGTKELKGRRPRVSFSTDGRIWTVPQKILEEGDWLWRITWHEGTAYGVSYRSTAKAANDAKAGGGWDLLLFKSLNGVAWNLVTTLAVPDRPNETTLRFLPDGRMVAMVRREAGDRLGWFGEARAPFTQWTWHQSNLRWGGPDFIVLPDGRWIAGTREYAKAQGGTAAKTGMIVASVNDFKLTPLLTLPSGGDTSYSAFVWHGGLLWTSYYSSHEGKTSIYLAKVKLP